MIAKDGVRPAERTGVGTGAARGIAALVGQLEEGPDLVDGETERARPADEAQSLEMVRPVQPITAGASRGRGQEPNALVVADRLDIAAGALRKRPDGEAD